MTTVTTSSYETKKQRLHEMIGIAASDAFNRYCVNVMEALYLHYLPAKDGRWGQLAVFTGDQERDGWELAECVNIPRNATRDMMHAWIAERARRLPILGE
jgi:hypothetical protein